MSFKSTIKSIIDEHISIKYKHIINPQIQYARVTKFLEDVSFDIYNVKLLDADKNIIPDYPEIPNLKAVKGFVKGDVVLVSCIESTYQIIGKVV